MNWIVTDHEGKLDVIHKEKCKSLGINVNTKRYRRYAGAGLLDKLDKGYVKEVKSYWKKHYQKSIDPILHLAFYNLTGKKDVRIVPNPQMKYEFIPFFNDRHMIAGYKDKNIYDLLIRTPSAPKIILKRVRGHYFNTVNTELDFVKAESILTSNSIENYIIKPSTTNNGIGIELLEVKEGRLMLKGDSINLAGLERLYGYNFMIQEVIKQHPIMETPHPTSVNTLRMVTQRWNNEIKYLQTFARFGSDNSVKDNAGAGGVCIGVKENGEFLSFAIDEDCNVYEKHPTTNYSFSEMVSIPNFEKYITFVKDLHKDILHMDFVSWDIAVGEDGEPILIEANFAGATWLYQLATGQPIFGEMTEDILHHIQSNREVKKDVGLDFRKLIRTNSRLRKGNKKQQKELVTMKGKLEEKNKHNTELKNNNIMMTNSTSWKITAPIRSIGAIFKKK